MKDLVLISGVSGAGKTTVANCLEDMGYLCIDQYPIELLGSLIELMIKEESAKYQKVALTIPILELDNFYSLLANANLNLILVLVDAKEEAIIKRYKFSRRVHPLLISNKATTLVDAVDIEKRILQRFSRENAFVIDTTSLSAKQTKEALDRILDYEDIMNFSVTFESFGFKYGVPIDADLVFDVRILDNPYYVQELRNLTGNDPEVYDYVMKGKNTKEYLAKLISFLDMTFESYAKDEKRHLNVCVGCTGGPHRSVTVANYLYEHYRNTYTSFLFHREQGDK